MQLPDLNTQLQKKNLFADFKSQLKKDFEESNCDTAFIEFLKPDFEEIRMKVATELRLNNKRPPFNLQQLLYRIDIQEKQLRNYLKQNAGEDYLEVVAEVIIKRILQKIVLRQYFSKHEHQKRNDKGSAADPELD
jgi:hypothetical protein